MFGKVDRTRLGWGRRGQGFIHLWLEGSVVFGSCQTICVIEVHLFRKARGRVDYRSIKNIIVRFKTYFPLPFSIFRGSKPSRLQLLDWARSALNRIFPQHLQPDLISNLIFLSTSRYHIRSMTISNFRVIYSLLGVDPFSILVTNRLLIMTFVYEFEELL